MNWGWGNESGCTLWLISSVCRMKYKTNKRAKFLKYTWGESYNRTSPFIQGDADFFYIYFIQK